jgi:hypothetical protein
VADLSPFGESTAFVNEVLPRADVSWLAAEIVLRACK